MGNWEIVIQGHGIHHNGRQDDAEMMAAVFVGEMQAAGHTISGATFVLTGQGDNLHDETDLLAMAAPGLVHYPNGLDDPQPYTDGAA